MKYIAHRGLSTRFPENTGEAFDAAVRAGARWVECDVWISRDGVPVVIHDETLERTTTGRGLVTEKTVAELNQYGVPTLKDVCDTVRGHAQLVIELKDQRAARIVGDFLDAYCAEETLLKTDVVVSSFKKNVLLEFHRTCPDVACAVLLWGTPSEDEIDLYASWGMSAVHLDAADGDVTESVVRQIHDRGMEVWVYTINDQTQAAYYTELGVDGVFTDSIDTIHG